MPKYTEFEIAQYCERIHPSDGLDEYLAFYRNPTAYITAKKREEAQALGLDFDEDSSIWQCLSGVFKKDTWRGFWSGFWEGLEIGIREREQREAQENTNDIEGFNKELPVEERERLLKDDKRSYEESMRAETRRILDKKRRDAMERIAERSKMFHADCVERRREGWVLERRYINDAEGQDIQREWEW